MLLQMTHQSDLKLSTGSAWKQSAASASLPSCLWTSPRKNQAIRFVGSSLRAFERKHLATGRNLGPCLERRAPIETLDGTCSTSMERALKYAASASCIFSCTSCIVTWGKARNHGIRFMAQQTQESTYIQLLRFTNIWPIWTLKFKKSGQYAL